MNLIALHMNKKEPECHRRKVEKHLSYRTIPCLISVVAKEPENAFLVSPEINFQFL
jgi:hypothetical protein